MKILAIEPYYGGSHQAFLDALIKRSGHDWSLATLPARHWKWRMRSAPIAMLDLVAEAVAGAGPPSSLLVSDMLDLPSFLGFAARDHRCRDWIGDAKIIVYFHENQWAYPAAPESQVDHHYGYTNLLSAAAATECWFNSAYNRDSFLELSHAFVSSMPDSRRAIDLDRIAAASRVIAPGFDPPIDPSPHPGARSPLRIGWVGRFEHDKRPDRFLELLKRLHRRKLPFELILLGQRGRSCETLDEIRQAFGAVIRFDGYAKSRQQYGRWLGEIDVVVSTAEHEFFGIAICESIWAGAIPVTPNDLSYREYVPDELRYESLDQAESIIAKLSERRDWATLSQDCRNRIADYRIDQVVNRVDQELKRIGSI